MAKRARSGSPTQSANKFRARTISLTASAAAGVLVAIFLLSPGGGIIGAAGLFACESGGWDATPSEAYTWVYAPPQGCTCQETGVPLADCKVRAFAVDLRTWLHADWMTACVLALFNLRLTSPSVGAYVVKV